MNRADFAAVAAAASPLLPDLSAFNHALRRWVAAQAWLDASTEPRDDEGPGAWAGFHAAQAQRAPVAVARKEALDRAEDKAAAALGRSLTSEERERGFAVSNVRGLSGAPARPEYFKPGRSLGDVAAPPRPGPEEEGPRLAEWRTPPRHQFNRLTPKDARSIGEQAPATRPMGPNAGPPVTTTTGSTAGREMNR